MSLHSLPTAHLHRIVSLSGSLTGKEIVYLHPCCRCKGRIGEICGDELILPVSTLGTRENVVEMFHLPPIPLTQALLTVPIVTVFISCTLLKTCVM